jgi:hypothetical protein
MLFNTLFIGFTTLFFGELIVCSDLQGQVWLHGKPVSGAVVTRDCHWGWRDEKIHHTVTTDAAGNFVFPEVVRKSFAASWLPHEPVIKIDVLIAYEGKSYKAFLTTKRNYNRNGEFKDQ